MGQLAYFASAIAALGIIAIGASYILNPEGAMTGFGLPLPQRDEHLAPWLRLKGVRDIVSGIVVLANMVWLGHWGTGLMMLVLAIIPVGDMLTILAAKGSVVRAFGVHGLTAAVMILAALALLSGWS